MEAFTVGQRVQVDGRKASIRYVGAIEGQQGLWVGLEWDDLHKGKHDGAHGGHRYFHTRGGIKAGTFVRANKLQLCMDTRCTLLDALKQKYDANLQGSDALDQGMRLSGRIIVELVGVEKLQRQRGGIDRVQEVVLSNACINSVGEAGELRRQAPCIRDLDISSNLLTTWDDIERLCKQLTSLHTLNLSHNLLSIPSQPPLESFMALRCLILNHCVVSFSQAMLLVPSFPNLEELYLEENAITDLTFDPALCCQLTNLKVLGLENNKVGEWEEVCKLGSLPALERLLLGSNQISRIFYPLPDQSKGDASHSFSSLKTLTLPDNQLADWTSIDALHRFPELSAFRLTDNPHPGNSAAKRFEVIARIGKLLSLNGSSISVSERKDCELQYLRETAGTTNLVADGVTFRELHPRLQELRERYGDVGAAVAVDNKPKPLGDSMLQVQLECRGAPGKGRSMTKKLPGSMTVGKLKEVCERLFKIPSDQQVISLMEDGRAPEELTASDNRELSFFTQKSALQIVIEEYKAQ